MAVRANPGGAEQVPGATYRIGAVARLTGISTHALRIWERRYGTFSSTRSPKGGRLYTKEDVNRLTTIRKLMELGHSIGALASLDPAQLQGLLATPPRAGASDAAAKELSELLTAVECMDVERLSRQLNEHAAGWPVTSWLSDVLGPLLVAVGERWAAGEWCVAQEHAASAAIRHHLGALLQALNVRARADHRAVVTTPPGERHELGALMAAVAAAAAGWKVTYLGPDLPVAEVVNAVTTADARCVLLSVPGRATKGMGEAVKQLRALLPPAVNVLVGGKGARNVTGLPGVMVSADLREVGRVLAKHGALRSGDDEVPPG